ncbi:hypothetical protein B9Z19DRAFT_1101284 [Tuber borchii]|uniref:Mid2 domain-containing protein n=1 Tax=Tuber borchii TaxID=42251 RepID=A0A2T6ZT12_TUBBO|nr:hypothetical protein B9Z19DRAFT_1101284 [Tuber borchii]
MGFHQKNSATVLLALLGLGSILGVNGSWLFGAMEEREEDYRRAMQPRQFVQCSAGSTACGGLGCLGTRRCCNAGAAWGCLPGNACYTVNGFVDCYSTTMVVPTISRKCYDFTQSGCTGGGACFTCPATAALCATEVLVGGGDTWLECATKATILTVTAAAQTSDASDTTTSDDSTITPADRTGTSTPIRTGTTTAPPSPTSTSGPSGLGGGAIAGIVIGAVAGLAIIAALIFFLCVRGDSGANGAAAVQPQYPQQQQPQMSYPPQPPYSPPPQQQQYAPQPPYSPLPGYQGQMAHNGYGPDGQPLAPLPVSSPVYPEPSKQPPTMPAELH